MQIYILFRNFHVGTMTQWCNFFYETWGQAFQLLDCGMRKQSVSFIFLTFKNSLLPSFLLIIQNIVGIVTLFVDRKWAKLCETQFIKQTAIYDNLLLHWSEIIQIFRNHFTFGKYCTLHCSTVHLYTKKPYDIAQSQLVNTHEKESLKIILRSYAQLVQTLVL